MKSVYLVSSFALCLLGGCLKNLTEKIDIDISVDYVQTHSDGSKTSVELIEFDNIEEAAFAKVFATQ